MAPIDPPDFAFEDLVPPRAPQDPPNEEDVVCAIKYYDDVRDMYYTRDQIPPEALAKAEAYRLRVSSAYAGVGPAPEVEGLGLAVQRLQESVDGMRREFQISRLETRRSLYILTRALVQAKNAARRDGTRSHYDEIPFPDGRLPSQQDPPLSRLGTLAAINALSLDEAREFLHGWGEPLPVGEAEAQLRQALLAVREVVGVSEGV